MTIAITEEFREKVKKAARSVANGVTLVEADDVEQDIWVRLLEDTDYYHELCEQEDPYRSLRRLGRQEAYKQATTLEHFSGQYTYTPPEVRVLLTEYLIDTRLEKVAEHVDLVEGLLLLKDKNKKRFNILIDKFVHGIDPPARMRVTEAVDSLTRHMNQANKAARYSYEGVGNRKVLTNSQSIARKDDSWS